MHVVDHQRITRTFIIPFLLILGIAWQPSAWAATAPAETTSVDLEEAIAIAFENSLTLTTARLNVQEAEVGLAQAEANNLVQPSPTNVIQARRRLEIAQRQILLDRFDLKFQVEESFYGVLRAENLAQVARDSLEVAQRQLEIAREKLERGAETQADVLSSASHVATSTANTAQAEGNYELALLNFRRQLGIDFKAPVFPAQIALEFVPHPVSIEEDIRFALVHRIEVLQAQTGIEAAAKQVELSRNDYTPPLTLRAADIALAKAEIHIEDLKQGIELEIRQANLKLHDAERRIPALATSVEEAEENLRVAHQLYGVDMAPFLQVMGAQVSLSRAKTDYVHAIFDYNLARARYDRAVARPLEDGETS